MDQAPQIQTYVVVSIFIFLAFAGILFYLLISLLTKQALLKKARAQLQEYSENLEGMVKERTAELSASEEKYRGLFENSQEGILVVSQATGKILKTNAAAGALFGYDQERLQQMHVRDLIECELEAGKPADWEELLIRRPDGSGRYIDCLMGNITYEGMDCWQVICRDITQKRQLEVQLLQSMKMAALGQLAAGVAHELNSPLNAITSSNFFLKRQIEDQEPKVQKHFELIETEISRCRKIINDLLNFSRSPTPTIDLSEVHLNEVLENCLGLMEKEIRAGGVNIVKEFQDLPPTMIDNSRITQVFFNLILNAIQAMPKGGNLSLRAWCDSDGNHPASAADPRAPQQICISIEDNGPGIPRDALPNIFAPFYTTKRPGGGVGLGLSVSREIVKLFKGDIKVESTVGLGSKFTVTLPVAG